MVSHGKRHLRRIVTVGAGILLVGGVVVSATSATAAQANARVPIAGTHPAWATASAHVAQQPTGSVTANVYLAGQNPAGLAAFATAVATPGNALYRHYLTPKQVMAQFGPSSTQVSTVTSWLSGAGLSVNKVVDSIGGYVQVQGSIQAATRAFGTSFGMFHGPDSQTDRAPDAAATVPVDVASDVSDISGLDTASHFAKPADTLPPPDQNYWITPQCSQYYGQEVATSDPSAYGSKQPYTNCGYTTQQIRGAYNVTKSGMTGKGVTVAIVDAYAAPTIESDTNQLAAVTGNQPFRTGQFTQDLSSTWTDTAADECDASGWYGEETLDVEEVHGMAPNANVVYVGAASCNDPDLLAAESLIVDNHLASIVSDSWGEPYDQATLTASYDMVFQAGAAEGIGFFFSSGDDGYESPNEDPGSDQIQVDYPTSSPWVTSVGGTSLAIGKSNNYEWETSWGTLLDPLSTSGTSWQYTPPGVYPDYYDGSGGGGVSDFYDQPSYQRGVVPNRISLALPGGAKATQPMRVIPDVAALADASTGFLIGETLYQENGTTLAFSLSRIGGTSLACPTFAGIEADAQQAYGHPIGFANPVIYQRYGTPAYHQVTDHPDGPGFLGEVRNNYTDPDTKTGPIVTYLRTLGINGEGADALPATPGYNDATGVGSPDLYIQSFINPYS
jgi:subtilase family serine protease